MNTDALAVVETRVDQVKAEAALLDVERFTRDVEARFSRFLPASELSALNDRSGQWTAVSSEMSEVLELAYGMHLQTGGIFEPAILASLERAGYDRSFELLPEDRPAAREAAAMPAHRFIDIELARGRARLPEGMRIDLGGIVKGWTADRAAERLAHLGASLVELGGDAAVQGTPPGDGWEIGVRAPGSQKIAGVVRVRAGGVATSGTDTRRWRRDGEWTHHLIDPRTGASSRSPIAQVTAFAPTAAYAEVWAKAALIGGVDASSAVIAAHPEVQLVLWPEGGEPVASPGVPFVYGPPVAA